MTTARTPQATLLPCLLLATLSLNLTAGVASVSAATSATPRARFSPSGRAAITPSPVTVLAGEADGRAAQDLQRYLYLQAGVLPGLALLPPEAEVADTAEDALRRAAASAWAAPCGGSGSRHGTGGHQAVVVVVTQANSSLHRALRAQLTPAAATDGLDSIDAFLVGALGRHGNTHAHVTHIFPPGSLDVAPGVAMVLCVGLDRQATRHAAYTLIERVTAVRFRLHGDVVPDPSMRTPDGLCGLAARFGGFGAACL